MRVASLGKRGYRAALRRGGASKAAPICRDCQREDRFAFDLSSLAGYARPTAGHRKCLARIMAQASGVQSGAYAEALLEQFEEAIREVQAVIDSEKDSKDKKIFFAAMAEKREFLAAKAKALGLGATAGRPTKGEGNVLPNDVTRDDLSAVAAAFLKAQEVPPPALAEPEPTDAQIDEAAEDFMCELAERRLAADDADAGLSTGAEVEVAVVDGEGSGLPS